MRFPKLKYPRLCRILTYVVVLGAFIAPIPLIVALPLPDLIKVPVVFALLIGLLIYMFKNFLLLMYMDTGLALLSCYRTARTVYCLPKGRTADVIRRSILRYGKGYEPKPGHLQPSALRYKHSNSMTVYTKGVERVVAAYEVDYLDKELYRLIFSSAKANSSALEGKKKSLLTDPSQRNAPLNRVTVVLILAHRVDPQLTPELYDLVCKRCDDEEKNCIIPCVVDLLQNTCVFNCLRIPYVGFEYAVKNRGIRIIKNRVFGGNLNLKENTHMLEYKDKEVFSPEDTLWDLWGSLHREFYGAPEKEKRQFESMREKEILDRKDNLCLKWDHRGVCLSVKKYNDSKTVRVEPVESWSYPKVRPIGKKIITQIEETIIAYYKTQGYTVAFIDPELGAVYTCKHVLEEDKPILYAKRDSEGDWQFLCSADPHPTEDETLVTILNILEIDPSAADAISLEPGQTASRENADAEWTIPQAESEIF